MQVRCKCAFCCVHWAQSWQIGDRRVTEVHLGASGLWGQKVWVNTQEKWNKQLEKGKECLNLRRTLRNRLMKRGFWAPIPMCVAFPHTNKQFLDTRSMPNNSTRFWCYLPGDRIRFHRWKVQSQETTLHFRCQPGLMINWLQIGGSNDPLLHLDEFARMADRTQENPFTHSITNLLQRKLKNTN